MEENKNIEEPIVESKPKRKIKIGFILKLLLSFALFAAGIYIIIISLKYKEPEKEKPIENDTVEINETNETINQTINSGDKVYLTGTNETIERELLILREDNSFVYSNSIDDNIAPVVGTYTIKGNELKLEEKVKYGSDGCFFKENWKDTFTGTISEDKINIKIDDEKLEFSLGELPSNILYNDKWYSTNPISGSSPDNESYDEWIDCDNLEN